MTTTYLKTIRVFKLNDKQQTVISKSSDSLFNCVLKLPNNELKHIYNDYV